MNQKNSFSFTLLTDSKHGPRAGVIQTKRGEINTPAFMPVGTAAAMKAMTVSQLKETGAQIILSNAYHLHNSPGEELIEKLGGLHRFMGWDGPMLTDSGGYQVFSLPLKKVEKEGVTFQYSKKGQKVKFTPEKSIAIQNRLGSDIIMAFDECLEHSASFEQARESLERTTHWAKRCKASHHNPDQALFGICQGAMYKELRIKSIHQLIEIGFPGYAIGGLSVGEGIENMKKVLDYTCPEMPIDKPRYVMGIGLPEDIFEAVERGIDMMDCVIPTKYARSGVLFTTRGRFRITQHQYKKDKFPVDLSCGCYCCSNFSRAYLNHLFTCNEVLSATLTSIHNTTFYIQLMTNMRNAIIKGEFPKFKKDFFELYFKQQKKKSV
ncbi:MAG: tRNA guanosine(34) transglycosylase Tgt [Deltaproteobacteria bacterium]|nr:tRNA guanosine(34) transglycosylase Tgt [Deltaproteobacteria bacterium]